MCYFKTFLSLLFYFMLCFKCNYGEVDQTNWVDPHDMSPVYDKEYFPYDINVDVHKNFDKTNNCEKNMDESKSNAYLRRAINMILNSVYEDSFNNNYFKGHLIFEIEIEKYKKLHDFANDRFDNLHEIDNILSEILKKPSHDYLKEYFLNWFAKIFKMISSRSGIFGMLILSYVFVIYKMLKGNLNYWVIFKFLFVNIVIFDFAFVWIRLYQKAEIEKLAISMKYKDAPDFCNPKTMSPMQYIRSLLSTVDQCKEYHHVTLTDIFWTVSPGDVLTEMLTKTITEPIKAIGPAIGHFIYGIYGTLPFGINLVLLPLVLVFVMIMSCITLSFVLKIPIKFNFFHLFSFSFGDQPQQNHGNVLTGQSVEKLLEIVNNTPRSIETHPPSVSHNDIREIVKKIERQISENSIKRLENKLQTDVNTVLTIKNQEEISEGQNINSKKQNINVKEQSNKIEEPNSENENQKPNFDTEIMSENIELDKLPERKELNKNQEAEASAQDISFDAENLESNNDEFLSNIKMILESPRSDLANLDNENQTKIGFEPNVREFDTSDQCLRRRKGNEGAGDN